MSNLDRILKLAGFEQDAHRQVETEEVTLEAAGVCEDCGCEIANPTEGCECTTHAHHIGSDVEEAVGDSAEGIFNLCDELGCEDHPVFNELVRYLDGDTLQDFVSDFRRHNDMNGDMEEAAELSPEDRERAMKRAFAQQDDPERGEEKKKVSLKKSPWESVEEASKPDFADIDGDGDKDEDMKKAAKDKEELEEAQSPAQKAAFAKMLASKGGKKADEDEGKGKEELEESPTMDTTQLITLLKNSGFTEEAIQDKLTEWANTPDGASEAEPTSHGDPYEIAQSVNLSLKRYLDADDMKVQVGEHHTVQNLRNIYESKKAK